MKNIVASVGLVAIGASGIESLHAQSVAAPDPSKPWSVSATLRGFYDDNPGTVPNNVSYHHRDAYGYEVSPSAVLTWALEQTTINAGFLYSYKYYDHNLPGTAWKSDQAFTFNVGVEHTFNEQVKAHLSDSFVVGQEPDLLRAGNTFSTFQRVSGDNYRNYGSIGLDAQVAPKVGIGVGYDNAFYDYQANQPGLVASGYPGVAEVLASTAGLLNRIENRAHIEGLYDLRPETKGILGYQFTDVDYTGNQYISGFFNPVTQATAYGLKSDYRNNREHALYVGAENQFSPNFSATIRIGASITDYYNSNASNKTSPYTSSALKYTYAPGSWVTFGVSNDRSATDLVGTTGNGSIVTDAQSLVLFGTLNHQITQNLIGNIVGQFQNSKYNGGAYDGDSEQYYLLGVNLTYRFNQYLATDIGYSYDRLSSALNNAARQFDRNRVYIGVTATY